MHTLFCGISAADGCCLLCLRIMSVPVCVYLQAGTPPGTGHGGRSISIDIDEAELLNDVEMGGMSHGELVAHIRRVQQELLAKVRA